MPSVINSSVYLVNYLYFPFRDLIIMLLKFLYIFLLLSVPAFASSAVFDVTNARQMTEALRNAGTNGEADVINVLSDISAIESMVYMAENCPLTINGNGFSVNGNKTYRCLEIKDNKTPFTNAHLTINSLVFRDGAALAAGGLLVNFRSVNNSSSITLIGCTFRGNRAVLYEYGWGGGAYLISYHGDINVSECKFEKNFSAGGGGGAKIEASGRGNVFVTGCRFSNNSAVSWYGGMLAHAVGGGTLCFTGNVIEGNSS